MRKTEIIPRITNTVGGCLIWPLIGLFKFWHYFISPFLGNNCRYFPSCSEYSCGVLRKYGLFFGLSLAIRRLSRCHCLCEGGVDLIP